MFGSKFGVLGLLVLWLATSGMTCLSTGCTSTKTEAERQGTFDRQMAGLREANFRGSVVMKSGGSPLGVNASTTWSLGPQQMIFEAEGTVDFTRPNASMPPFPVELLSEFNDRLRALESKQRTP